jgi:hypothetical protein
MKITEPLWRRVCVRPATARKINKLAALLDISKYETVETAVAAMLKGVEELEAK